MTMIRIPRKWERFAESDVTPERKWFNRRRFLTGMGLGGGAGWLALEWGVPSLAGEEDHYPAVWADRWRDRLPAPRSTVFKEAGRPVTDEGRFESFNNFYEFSLNKRRVKSLVKDFQVEPWRIEVAGEVDRPAVYDLDDLARVADFEERVYRFRCVEAWSAVVPWTGYPFSRLLDFVGLKRSAAYVRFVAVYRPSEMPNQTKRSGFPWPYYEALRLDEARNDLALLTFGMYGHPLTKQNGAPVRLILPWKYGFKSIKSIVRIEVTRDRPRTFWTDTSKEYGFYGNVNPRFGHRRWKQESELFLNTGDRIPTQLYNGYGEQVAELYDENRREYFF